MNINDKITVAVLGSTGMLGHAVADELEKDPNILVFRYGRKHSSTISKFDALVNEDLYEILNVDYVINCIGVIWQANNPNRSETFNINSIFPWLLQRRCYQLGAKLIHVSTDCVFSGKIDKQITHKAYTEEDIKDVNDDYGLSKSLGETRDAMVLRTSVIGFELKTKRSFLEWAFSNAGKQVNGYTNHVWNGVTSFEYAKICRKIILSDLFDRGIYHVFSEVPVSKFELLQKISDTFQLNLSVKPVEAPDTVIRVLDTVKPLCKTLKIPDIQTMLCELRDKR